MQIFSDMKSGVVIAVNLKRALFAVQIQDGECAVFRQRQGPLLLVGDKLKGNFSPNSCDDFSHRDGICQVSEQSGRLTLKQALGVVNGGVRALSFPRLFRNSVLAKARQTSQVGALA
jgi:uncharacterized protein YigE (DUF2233 family)